MSFSLFLLKRYIKSSKNSRFISAISSITIIGIALGVTVVIIALTILDGFEKIVSSKIIDLNSHIKITSFGNRDLPNNQSFQKELQIKFGNYFQKIDPFISKLAIIKSKKNVEGITITGLDEKSLAETIDKFIKQGSIEYSNNSLSNIFIGQKLAERLYLKVGDKITLISLHKNEVPTTDNPPSIEQFIVGAIFESRMSEYDDLNAYILLQDAVRFFGMENEISGYNIKLNELSKIDPLSEKIQDHLGYPYYVRTVFKIHQNIFTWLELQKEPIPIILGLIIFVAVFNIISTLLMIVLERTNSIGIFRSLGMNRKKIIGQFIMHGLYLTIIGIAIGNLLAYVFSYLQLNYEIISLPEKVYFVTKVPISILWENFLFVSIVTMIISFFSSLIPSIIASKIKPISAIRFD
jgi:lipoprotein-releasing system permease protein